MNRKQKKMLARILVGTDGQDVDTAAVGDYARAFNGFFQLRFAVLMAN